MTGKVKRTHLALSMHTMRGNRGNYLAEAIRQKWVQGCDVRVSYGLIGYHTKGVIAAPTKRGRIPLRSTGMDYNTDDNFDLNNDGVDDLILDYYSHQKYFIIQGTYNGVPDTSMVLTGSVNWSSLSTANDEVWFPVRGAVVAKKYLKNFDYQWNNTRNTRNAYTTTYANFRVRREGAATRRHHAHRLADRTSPGHHRGARPLPPGSLLGSRLTGPGVSGGPPTSGSGGIVGRASRWQVLVIRRS